MRKRNHRVEIYFTKTELEALTKKVRKSGLSREGFCRRILNGAAIKENPPADVPMLIREVRRAGYHMDQLLKIARANNWLSVKELEKALESNRASDKLIAETYTMEPD